MSGIVSEYYHHHFHHFHHSVQVHSIVIIMQLDEVVNFSYFLHTVGQLNIIVYCASHVLPYVFSSAIKMSLKTSPYD